MPIVTFAREHITIDVPSGTTVREAAKQCGIELYSHVFKVINCYGFGLCGECRVIVTDGAERLSTPSAKEFGWLRPRKERHLGPRGIYTSEGERLPCQAQVLGPVTVWTRPRDGRPPKADDPREKRT